ncbi:MAG: DNA-directed RNA polymerase subunit alpha [Clostridia bacterium]|jgi:DNA-directed RNA polymerase subunit alpha|nr:DNA-directed RNA polymerase subunit alpha [Clostridia bacterium]MDD3862582.1 DNA-directed RNA polymerase subunit alpha [Clostridia bacterium]
MIEIEKPKLTCEETENGYFAKFIVEPLEKGYGITLGNCMRRTLLSAMPGVAPIGIKIAGVQHEFSTIPGVVEDVVDIVLNVKQMVLKSPDLNKEIMTSLRIKKNTPGEIKAGDFEPNDLIDVLNPQLHICTLDENASVDMEILVGKGRGYVPNIVNKERIDSLEYIAIDSLYSPVLRVSYNVESTRVGQNINFDKLTLEVKTNGSMTAKDIVSLAGKIVIEHISMFGELSSNFDEVNVLVSKEDDVQSKILEMPIEEMDFSVRSYNCLKRANINTIEDLVSKTRTDMLKVRNLGLKSIEEVVQKLDTYGLGLRQEED